ncbi:hypothetical protein C8J57DRAFT_1646556 [Mycena rebaudengoi]|nr:hypothetical protein C8J57DRAFT_1646556 [Mycena rebaudengoi]
MIIVDDECGRRNAVDLRHSGELHEFYVADERRQEFVYFIFICILAVNQFLVDKGIAPDEYLLLKLQLQQKKTVHTRKVSTTEPQWISRVLARRRLEFDADLTMGKRKFMTETVHIPDSDDEADTPTGNVPTSNARSLLGMMIEETTAVTVTGEWRRSTRAVPVPASPKKSHNPALTPLLPDEWRNWDEAPPLYELPTEPDDGVGADVDEDDDVEGGRTLRDSCIRSNFPQDDPLRQWVEEHRDAFLDEFLRWEGRGDHVQYSTCHSCNMGAAEYRCMDCMGRGELICLNCLRSRHRQLILHRVEKWNGQFFDQKTLRELEVRLQLGHWHEAQNQCPVPKRLPNDSFVIIDDHGVHEVFVDFCGCGRGGSHVQQLLRAQLFPVTTTRPATAATFSVLRRFHLLSFESKCSMYEFYHSLARETDNTSTKPSKNRYHEWRRMTRKYRNLQMAERAGRGHDPGSCAATSAGECAVLCPACPQPGKNLLDNWCETAEEHQFLYALYLAMDANFRLKRKDVSSEKKDPGLGEGWAFFCELKEYMEHVNAHWNQPQERSHCVAHDAVDKPDKDARGTVSSGIGAVDCARHNMRRAQAVADLQLGERYINMDYMFLRSVKGTELVRFYVSYDIACQWHINIWMRMAKYKSDIHFRPEGRFITFLVPKFHLLAHIEACNLLFSFNLTHDVGMTDGEAPERGWANANPLAGSTKEMGPGSRHDHLNDHFNDWNYKKIIAFGRAMLDKIQKAVPEMVGTKLVLEEMVESLEKEAVDEWTKMAEEWEKDATKPNPFETHKKDAHLANVRYELAREAAEKEAAGEEDVDAVRADMHVTERVAMGIQLEEQQRVLGFDVAATGQHPTDDQRRVMVERTSKLRRKILAWMDIQARFFLIVMRIREPEDRARTRAATTQVVPGILVHEMVLWMPSGLVNRPGARDDDGRCKQSVLEFEYCLRVGQAHEALDDIRSQLLVRTHLYKWQDLQIRGVRGNTCSQGKIDTLDERIRRATEQYHAARRALVVLGRELENNAWEKTLKPLAAGDVRGMPRATFGDEERQCGKKGKGKAVGPARKRQKQAPVMLSWIWLSQGAATVEGQAPSLNEALRIEWAKAHARSLRWSEEVQLLEEEMRHIQQFLLWHGKAVVEGTVQKEGDMAYALRQAVLKETLAARFKEKWGRVEELIRKGQAGELVVLEAVEAEEVEEDSGTEDDPVPEIPARRVQGSIFGLD